MSGRRRLVARTVEARSVDAGVREALWRLYDSYYCDSDPAVFARDFAAKHHVILLTDRSDGTVRGFSTLKRFEAEIEGRRVGVVYSGDTLIHPDYWGETALQRAFFRYIVAPKLRWPGRLVYWFLISKGYKTYLLLSRNFPAYWPRHDQPTPSFEAALLDHLGHLQFAERWVPERGILIRGERTGRLREHVAPISADLVARAPDVRFFVEKNPGHAEGDELCCLGRIDPAMWLNYLQKLARRSLRAVPGGRWARSPAR